MAVGECQEDVSMGVDGMIRESCGVSISLESV
jgi:hypothetical protein